MADNTVNETGFSPAQIRTISEIIAAALAQDRAQNQVPPTSSNQPIVEGREAPEHTLGSQASADNASPTENELIKQIAELKDKGRFVDQDCEYHQCKGHSTDNCLKLRHDIQDLIDSGKITTPPEHNKPAPGNH
ncbi:hypothetical protein JCGZ_10979 [Jatropha curcas]|uniref:Uncharacterized protein n=1 Tax=Jatropha curcas TaxID=180498 RepID=A0A067KK25_JATCU|nr:hypothetical protein JCGZ_10979 [Jatropha curcas]